MEGKPIYMTDVPDDYMSIKSGLGGASPNTVLITPLRVNDEKFGVIELASFKELEPYQLEFVQKVSESIAATISTVNINIRTNKLLAQSKEQAEQMANAEEELRQNMEEMQATHEEMRRREADMQETLNKSQQLQNDIEENQYEAKQFNDAILATCNVNEFSADFMLISINDNLLSFFKGLTRNDFVGKHLSGFIGEGAFNATRQDIEHGRIHEEIQHVNMGNGKTKTFIDRFIPIKDKSGNLQRVLMLAFPDEAEELRQNIEAAEEKSHETKQFYNAIIETCNVVEYSPDAIITDVNDNFLKIFISDRSNFIGKPMNAFMSDEVYRAVMKSINAGKIYEDVQSLDIGGGKTLSVTQRFIPIQDRSGKLQRILMLAFQN
jgi:PAS domain-containing protein